MICEIETPEIIKQFRSYEIRKTKKSSNNKMLDEFAEVSKGDFRLFAAPPFRLSENIRDIRLLDACLYAA